MQTPPLRRLLLVGALCASVGGLAACGSDELATDIEPSRSPPLTAPTGDGLASGAGGQANDITDLPSTPVTTGPTPAAAADSDDDAAASSSSDPADTGASDTSDDTATDTSTGSGAAAGSGGTGGTSTPSGSGSGSGTTTSGSGSGSGSGTTTSGGSGSGGGATPSEFGEFCDTNPGVCR